MSSYTLTLTPLQTSTLCCATFLILTWSKFCTWAELTDSTSGCKHQATASCCSCATLQTRNYHSFVRNFLAVIKALWVFFLKEDGQFFSPHRSNLKAFCEPNWKLCKHRYSYGCPTAETQSTHCSLHPSTVLKQDNKSVCCHLAWEWG